MFFNITPLTKLPFSKSQSFTYSSEADFVAGQIVEINFANRKILGVVLSKLEQSELNNFALNKIKSITKVIENIRLNPEQITLANFIADYYYTSVGLVLKAMVPPVMKRPIKSPPDKGGWGVTSANTSKKSYLYYDKTLTEKAKQNRKTPTKAESKIWKEVLRGKHFQQYKFIRQKPIDNFIVDFYCAELMLVIEIDGFTHGGKVEYDEKRTEVLKKYGLQVVRYTDEQVLSGIEGVYYDLGQKIQEQKERLDLIVDKRNPPNPPYQGGDGNIITPTPEQYQIIQDIEKSTQTTHLLHGVTGSGKTEIYLQLIKKAIEQNKQSIVMVPEISLTPQAIERYSARFGTERIAVTHSNLSNSEKFLAWQKIKNNEVKIIIGPRSAIFAPVVNLAYIIIDEEHDSSYKQYDQNPRYQAQVVAEKLATIYSAKLVLGSATPSLTSYYRTEQKEIGLHQLTQRISGPEMPKVDIVDMRDEFKKRNYSIFSDLLQDKIQENLAQKKQVILYLNRRGAATFVSCRDCGFVEKCPNCEIPLTYHLKSANLICHHCNFQKTVSLRCPHCQSVAFKYFGTGTQKVEAELKKLFPKARILRIDKDSTTTKDSHDQFYQAFKNHQYDILIGTQMITKGWDLPRVGLVGIITTDITLNLPDFSANERAFQLITQVAGRTGRGQEVGEVILQTYSPDNFVIKLAAKHDSVGFYQQEIKNRAEFFYPPFSRLIKLFLRHPDKLVAEKLADELFANLLKLNYPESEIEFLGPAPDFIPKINNNYLYQIIIKIKNKTLNIDELLKKVPHNWIIDIDPESLL